MMRGGIILLFILGSINGAFFLLRFGFDKAHTASLQFFWVNYSVRTIKSM